MIVVDTSVWIEVLGGRRTRKALRCVELIEDGEPVALTEVIFHRGTPRPSLDEQAELVERHLRAFPVLRLDDFALAADLYRTARGAGVAVRKTLDCLIS